MALRTRSYVTAPPSASSCMQAPEFCSWILMALLIPSCNPLAIFSLNRLQSIVLAGLKTGNYTALTPSSIGQSERGSQADVITATSRLAVTPGLLAVTRNGSPALTQPINGVKTWRIRSWRLFHESLITTALISANLDRSGETWKSCCRSSQAEFYIFTSWKLQN